MPWYFEALALGAFPRSPVSASRRPNSAKNEAARAALDRLREELSRHSDRAKAFESAAELLTNRATQKALRAHARLARRLTAPPPRGGRSVALYEKRRYAYPQGSLRSCSLCHEPSPHRTTDQWRRHFTYAGSRKSIKALLRKYDTPEKRRGMTEAARAELRRRREERWLATLDPRTVRVLGRQQALRQAITAINRTRDKHHQIKL